MPETQDECHPIDAAFAADGPLAGATEHFRPRPQQLEMAHAVYHALREAGVLVAEAGTGTGKTFAYLVPALLFGGRVIISTGTKTLQDQIFNRDLPAVRDALRVPVSIALLKGRANYVCPYWLARHMNESRFYGASTVADLRRIARFMQTSKSGDKAECAEVREDSLAWSAAVSTRENCLGQQCPNLEECFVAKARERARQAEVVVVNHHLFFADLALRSGGMGELLPDCQAVVFDEAHQLGAIASEFFGESISSAQLVELAKDTRTEATVAGAASRELVDVARKLEQAASDLRILFHEQSGRFTEKELFATEGFAASLKALEEQLAAFMQALEAQAERSEGLAACLARGEDLHARLARWQAPQAGNLVRWGECFARSLSLRTTPLSIAETFHAHLVRDRRAWVFASATLAVGEDFSHYCNEMGLNLLEPPAQTRVWGSPFSWREQAVLYAAQGLPDPNDAAYPQAVARAAWPLIRAMRGRAFVLCTSLRAMRTIHETLAACLRDEADAEIAALPLLLQGEATKTELLERFRALGNAILVASQSFWEGVDVPGEALSLVIIDKLPFTPPDDPVLSARIERMRAEGGNPFMHYQLPRAIIQMKQGAGRLIRSERDRGLLCICDGRLLNKPYGAQIWRSLPPMRRTSRREDALGFLAGLRNTADSDGQNPP